MIDQTKNEAGYTLLELLLAVILGAIVLAGCYASYSIVAVQYQRNSNVAEIRDFAIPTIRLLTRDIRMAGYVELNPATNLTAFIPAVANPIQIINNINISANNTNILTIANGATPCPAVSENAPNNCSDAISVIYDVLNPASANTGQVDRRRVTYFIAPRTVGTTTRNALFMNTEIWSTVAVPADWGTATTELVADFVEDFQVEGFPNNISPTFIRYSLVFRSRGRTTNTNTFTKLSSNINLLPAASLPNFSVGDNDAYTITDNFLREEFSSAVYIRN